MQFDSNKVILEHLVVWFG